ncbi:hypothetical protein [Sphingomonas nostoxanthinifaciens]|uniref:hypothetical protein n=1 Tax=Sphingomonas nostoxanthinifaciens TaxID=2872652 RepID=UPI001CC219B3|nr:hypothetical protein [Sphingomonas nostoxanthinifaciens]UAK24185.1 hypothetical protein K8P63_17940 [Sphingomonas nostoxanthinifaciens]
MSLQLDILAALKVLARSALPAADVDIIAPEDDLPAADRLSPDGRIVIEYGDPGEPEIDLCPPTYNYEHQIPIGFAASKAIGGDSAVRAVASMIDSFSAAIAADRTLGGLVDYLDAAAPAIDDMFTPGATPAREAQVVLTAIYATTRPL